MDKKDGKNKILKKKVKALDAKVEEKYGELTIDEIKELLFEETWMKRIKNDISEALDLEINGIASKLVEISKRYEKTLGELEAETEKSRDDVKKALERMGYTW